MCAYLGENLVLCVHDMNQSPLRLHSAGSFFADEALVQRLPRVVANYLFESEGPWMHTDAKMFIPEYGSKEEAACGGAGGVLE
jgi:hypothetical protein